MNESVVSFYQALFGGALTFYGIAAAVIIAAVQIVQSNLNFRVNWFKLLGKRNVILIFVSTAINLLIIGVAVGATSFSHSIICGDQHSYRVFDSLWYLALVGLCTLWLIYVAVRCTSKILSSLLPANLIRDLIPSVAPPGAITDYVLYRYATEPHKPFVVDIFRYASVAKTKKKTAKPKKDMKPAEAKKLLEKATEGDPKRLEAELEKYQQIKADGRKSDDPLVPLVSIMRNAVRDNDTQTLAQAHDQLIELLIKCKVTDDKDIGVSDSLCNQTNNCIINYYVDVMTSIFDMSISAEAFNCSKEIVRLTFDAVEQFEDMQNWVSKSLMYNFWEHAGTAAVNKDLATIFIAVLKMLSDFAIAQIDSGNSEEDVLSKLTRLLERRFMRSAPDREPTLEDRSGTSDYAESINALVNLGSAYERKAEKANPRLYLVALSFVAKHLIQNYLDSNGTEERIKDTVVMFMIDHISFARQAAFKGNSMGFFTAYIEFKLFDWRLEDDNDLLGPFKTYMLTGLIDLADIAIKHRGKLIVNDYYRGHEWFVEEVLKRLGELHDKWPNVNPEQRKIIDLTAKGYEGETGSPGIVDDFANKVQHIFPIAD